MAGFGTFARAGWKGAGAGAGFGVGRVVRVAGSCGGCGR